MTTITEKNLQECYLDATKNNGLIQLTINLNNSYFDLKIHDIKMIFKNSSLWNRSNQNTGHCKFTHEITKIVVEFQGHSKKKDRTIKPKIRAQILKNVQAHLNILSNDIFKYTIYNWKTTPDYTRALRTIKNRHLVI